MGLQVYSTTLVSNKSLNYVQLKGGGSGATGNPGSVRRPYYSIKGAFKIPVPRLNKEITFCRLPWSLGGLVLLARTAFGKFYASNHKFSSRNQHNFL